MLLCFCCVLLRFAGTQQNGGGPLRGRPGGDPLHVIADDFGLDDDEITKLFKESPTPSPAANLTLGLHRTWTPTGTAKLAKKSLKKP